MRLEKRELWYAFVGFAFLTLWFLKLQDFIAPLLAGLPQWVAFIIFNSGLFVGAYILSLILTGRPGNVQGSIAAVSFLFGVDIWTLPHFISSSGAVVKTVDFWYLTSDSLVGSFYQGFLPMAWVSFFTYVITPFFLVFLIPIVVTKPKEIQKLLFG